MTESNGQAPWIRFGDRDNEILHPDTASAVLMMLRARHPGWFGALLAEAVTGTRPKAVRERAAS